MKSARMLARSVILLKTNKLQNALKSNEEKQVA